MKASKFTAAINGSMYTEKAKFSLWIYILLFIIS